MRNEYKNILWRERKRNCFGLPWTFTVYILTDTKIIIRSGILMIKEEEIELYKITDKKLLFPLLGRIFGYGVIEFNANDTYTPNVYIRNIPNTREFANLFEEAIDKEKEKYDVKGRDIVGMVD